MEKKYKPTLLESLYDNYKSLKEQINQSIEFYEKSQLHQMLSITEQQICHHIYNIKEKEDPV